MMMQQPMRLLNLGEVARRLGVSRKYARVLAGRPDFPSPYAITGGHAGPMRLWHPDDIEGFADAFARRSRRRTSSGR